MKIPKSFKLGGVGYKVKMLKKLDEHDSLGLTLTDAGSVKIKRDQARDRLEHTMCHELFHCLFEAAGREDLSSDEGLVDVMALLLHQYLESQKGEH